jgi:dTDP-4-amino-4,6-dideoxygalactose transaminase
MPNKRIFLSPPHISKNEQKYVQEAFDLNWIAPMGKNVNEFEQAIQSYLKEEVFVTALNSGTSALHLALILLGIKKGDTVLCQSFTFCGSANPILYQGAKPIFIDSETETWNLCPKLLEKAIFEENKKGNQPKALILVHLYGMPAKLNEILAICNQHKIILIEDGAESLGSQYNGKKCGTFGQYGILSFNGNKIITTSSGGALVTRTNQNNEKAKFLSSQAKENTLHYEHKELGYNYRMSNILAGIGRGQMEVLEERINQKRDIFSYYKKELEPLDYQFLKEPENAFSNRWLSTMICPSNRIKNEIIKTLEKNNIESRPLWKPMHLQPLYKNQTAYTNGTSGNLFDNGICLPSGTALTKNELDFIVQAIKKVK